MYEVSNRKCFGGPYKVPITQFNRQTWWPPKWIECDCGEHAEHIFYRKKGTPIQQNVGIATRAIENTKL